MSNIIPPKLVQRLSATPGFDTAAFEAAHGQAEGVTSIRINPAKPLVKPDPAAERVPWCDTGWYLPERPLFTLDPLFHAGCYYVQEASSMFVAHVLDVLGLRNEPQTAIDLCAAPGGKSTLLNTYLHPDSLLIANELIKTRVHILADNLIRWGQTNTVVTNNDPSAFRHLPGYADLLLVDAPCSGSGLFRKDPSAIDEWSEAVVQLCSERQQRILADSLPALREGGILIYSTCSYSEEENEAIADWLCDTQGVEPVTVPIDPAWGIEQTASPRRGCPGYRFYPHRLRGEGFFLAVFRKIAPQDSFDRRRVKTGKPLSVRGLDRWVVSPDRFTAITVGEDIHLIPKDRAVDLSILQRMLYLRNAGTKVGRIVKDELIPAHDLAMSLMLHPDVPRLALDHDAALDYLRKGPLPASLNAFGRVGWFVADFDGAPLGWMKILSNRINNYYPKEWRIVSR